MSVSSANKSFEKDSKQTFKRKPKREFKDEFKQSLFEYLKSLSKDELRTIMQKSYDLINKKKEA